MSISEMVETWGLPVLSRIYIVRWKEINQNCVRNLHASCKCADTRLLILSATTKCPRQVNKRPDISNKVHSYCPFYNTHQTYGQKTPNGL